MGQEDQNKFDRDAYIREIKGLPPEGDGGGDNGDGGAGDAGDGGAGDGGAGGGAGGEGGGSQTDFVARIEATLKQKDPNYVLPEYIRTGETNGIKLTDQQITEALAKELAKANTTDTFMQEYMEASKDPNFNRQEWLKNRMEENAFLELNGDEFLRSYLKMLYKEDTDITDEDIEAELGNMTKIAKKQLEKDVKQQFKEMNQGGGGQQRRDVPDPEITPEMVQMQKRIDADVLNYTNAIRDKGVIGGFQFAEADRGQFIEDLPTFTKKTVREANGRKFVASDADQVLTEILINPKAVLDILPYLWLKKNGKLDGYFSGAVERTKEELEKKLGTDPKHQRGVAQDKGFNREKFSQDAKNQS